MVCDNCQVKTFTARGTGCRVNISVSGMAGLSVDATVPNAVVPKNVLFDPVTPGATAVQDLSVLNLTPLKLAYRWEITDGEGPSRPGTAMEALGDGSSGLLAPAASSTFEISPASGLLALNGTTHFEVSFAPEAASTFPGHARLVIEGVPAMAVDDVDVEVTQSVRDVFQRGRRQTVVRHRSHLTHDLNPPGEDGDDRSRFFRVAELLLHLDSLPLDSMLPLTTNIYIPT